MKPKRKITPGQQTILTALAVHEDAQLQVTEGGAEVVIPVSTEDVRVLHSRGHIVVLDEVIKTVYVLRPSELEGL